MYFLSVYVSHTCMCARMCVCICVLYMHVYMFNMWENILCAQIHRHMYLHPCGELTWAISDHCPSYSLRPGLSMEPRAHGYWISYGQIFLLAFWPLELQWCYLWVTSPLWPPVFMWVLGSKLKSSHVYSKNFDHSPVSPAQLWFLL